MPTNNVNLCTHLSDFVSPSYCEMLQSFGVRGPENYKWLILRNARSLIVAPSFDPHDVYENSEFMIQHIKGGEIMRSCPAFTATQIAEVLPDFMIIRNKDGYEVSLDAMYSEVPMVTESKLPDALARLLIEALRKRVLKPKQIANALNHSA